MSTSFIYPTPPRRHLCAALLAALLAAPGAHAAVMCGSTPYTGGDCYGNTSSPPTVTIESGDTVFGLAVGHHSATGNDVFDGHVSMTGGTALQGVWGGRTTGGDGSATGNTVEISGDAEVGGNGVFGGVATGTGDATGNTVTLRGGSTFSGLYGGRSSGSGDVVKDNTLNVVNVKGLYAGTYIANFAILNFTLPADIQHGDNILTASRAIFPAAATKVDIKVTGSPALKVGDEIKLVSASYSLTINNFSPTTFSSGSFEFEVSRVGNDLIAKVTKTPPPGSATAVPTLGGAGLALTALALPAFAAPALRRRKKTDTNKK